MSARALVVGLDGADLDLIEQLGPEQLPNMHALMLRGATARLESVQPPATLPNWTTFLTGLDPGQHGVFDFTLRDGYRVAFTAGTIREAPTIASRLDRLGMRCACIGFPATWPPEPLEHGVFISGWDSPVAFEADRSFVSPPALYDAIVSRFGAPRFDDVDEFNADAPGWHAGLGAALEERIKKKTELALWLLEGEAWDLFAFYFGESDTVAHHLFSLFDARSPRHPDHVSPTERDGLPRVYRALDAAVGTLVEAAGADVDVTLISDHGSGPSSDKVLYLNRALEEAGLLTFRERSPISTLARHAKDAALLTLPQALRQRAFSLAGRALPGWIESRARFGAIDFGATRAFSDELNYFPSITFNQRGREPRGTIEPHERDALINELNDALHALRDPWTGQKVVRHVWRREALYAGPFIERAPDVLLELELDGSSTYNLMPSSGAPPGTGPWRRLEPREYLGRKGRSLPGSHRTRGIYVTAGPSVAAVGMIEARMADTTATVLTQLGVQPSADMPGRCLREALIRRSASSNGHGQPTLPPASVKKREPPRGSQDRLEGRLRALGYID